MSDGNSGRTTRAPHLRWVPITDMEVSVKAQREFNQAQAEKYAADFDLEALGYPVVNKRGDRFYIVDGQHRIAALKLMGWDDQQLQCECYDGLTEQEEAELFLRRDERRPIGSLDKYRISLTAERDIESDIDRVVRSNNLVVSRNKVDGAILAVGTLRKIYVRAGPETLGRTLRIIRDAFGGSGFEAAVIDGIGLVCARYNDGLDDAVTVKRLGDMHGGVNGLLGRAATLRRQTGNQKAHCVAAAAVDVINGGRGGKKLTPWFKATALTVAS